MNITTNKTPVEADVHAKGLLGNLFKSFFDKLGDVLIGDFRLDDITYEPGKSPFNVEQLKKDSGGRDPIFYSQYEKQEKEKDRWEKTEDNPDSNGFVQSEPTNQIVVSDQCKTTSDEQSPDFKVVFAPIASKGYEGYMVAHATYTADGKTQEKQGFFKSSELEKWTKKLAEEWGVNTEPDMVNESETEASTKMTVTLQKVTGSTSYDITLTKITANYNLSQVAEDLDAILSDDAFVEAVPESETTYLVVTDDEGDLDVTEIEDDQSSVADIYQQLMNQTGDMLDYLKIVRWGAKGAIRNDFMSTTESMRWSFEGILDKLGEWIITETGKTPQIIHTNEIIDIDNLTAVELANAVIEKVNEYIDNLDIVYVDFSSEQQSYIDTFKESIKSMCEYSLGRLILQ